MEASAWWGRAVDREVIVAVEEVSPRKRKVDELARE